LARSGQEAGYHFRIIDSVMKVNERQKTTLVDKVKAHYGENLRGRHFALWGLAFTPDTDDIREAPALYMIDALTAAGATITAFDPEAMANVQKVVGDKINYATDEYAALDGADALLIATEWALFRNPDLAQLETKLRSKAIFDGRNLYDLDEMKEKGFHYVSVGRQAVNAPIKANA